MSTFGQELLEALPELRQMAESRMTTMVTIRTYGPWEYDDAAGKEVRPLLSSFETKARVRVRSVQQLRETEVGPRTVVSVDRELHIPWNADEALEGSEATVDTIDATTDPTLLGAVLMLAGPLPGDQMTARRLLVREVLT